MCTLPLKVEESLQYEMEKFLEKPYKYTLILFIMFIRILAFLHNRIWWRFLLFKIKLHRIVPVFAFIYKQPETNNNCRCKQQINRDDCLELLLLSLISLYNTIHCICPSCTPYTTELKSPSFFLQEDWLWEFIKGSQTAQHKIKMSNVLVIYCNLSDNETKYCTFASTKNKKTYNI